MTLQIVCGNTNAPIPGTVSYQSDLLRYAIVEFLIVNNSPENCLLPNPDFTHDPLTGTITRGNQWVVGDKIIIIYSKCNC